MYLREFPGNVWLAPDDIVMMRPVAAWYPSVDGSNSGYTPEVEVSMRGGGYHRFSVGKFRKEDEQAHAVVYAEAANWIQNYVLLGLRLDLGEPRQAVIPNDCSELEQFDPKTGTVLD
jgi:hypothetical protein